MPTLAARSRAHQPTVAGGLRFALPPHLEDAGDPCTFGIRPEEIAFAKSDADGIAADIVGTERLGGESVYHLDVAGHAVKALWRGEHVHAPRIDLAVASGVVFRP